MVTKTWVNIGSAKGFVVWRHQTIASANVYLSLMGSVAISQEMLKNLIRNTSMG